MPRKFSLRALLVPSVIFVFALVITACGGSGSPPSDASPATAPSTTSTSTTTNSSTTTRPPAGPTSSTTTTLPPTNPNVAFTKYENGLCEVTYIGGKWKWYEDNGRTFCYVRQDNSWKFSMVTKVALYNQAKHGTPARTDFERDFDVEGTGNPVFDTLLIRPVLDGADSVWRELPLTDAGDTLVRHNGIKYYFEDYVNAPGVNPGKARYGNQQANLMRDRLIRANASMRLPVCEASPVGCAPTPSD